MTTLTVDEAISLILSGITPLEAETVGLLDAHNRVLAADVAARLTQPPFAASAMDGYAVRNADIATLPATLTVVGEAAAGSHYAGTLKPGEAVRILTGAPVPDGCDAIVIQENTDRAHPNLTIREGTPDAAHIRPRGGDFMQGHPLLKAGRTLDARALTLAAAAGHATLPVRRRPRVAILATGSELVPPGTTPGPDQIVSSNPIGLAALIKTFGGDPILLPLVPDNLAAITANIDMARNADILVTSGGASVGDHDLVRPALESLGVKLDFWKLAMRPGNPVLFGRLGQLRVIGVPGNPVSALLCARIFVCPLIGALLGKPATDLDTATAILAHPLEANGPRQHYMRAVHDTDGKVTAVPNQDSSLLVPLAKANALIVRAPRAPTVGKGASVDIIRIDF
ncbi:MAG: gephyrin-like molybdotransferase Glp [Hyphomicrobiaceae bacterium]